MKTLWTDEIVTPLGPVSCVLVSDIGIDVQSLNPTNVTTGGYTIQRSSQPLARDWNLGLTPTPQLIDGGCCWKWLFTRTGSRNASLKILCGLIDPNNTIWDSATGENLAAVEYRTEGSVLHIGTEDDESLFARSTKPTGAFPPRLGELFRTQPDLFDNLMRLDQAGLTITVPTLHTGESIYFHIIAAFNQTSSREDISTWLAVDRKKSHLDLSRGDH